MEKNKPARVLRDGNLKATIWANQGENGVYFTATLAKTFTDREGKVRDTASFSSAELLRIGELSRLAYHGANELRAEYKRNFNPTAAGQPIQPQSQLPYQQTQAPVQQAPAQASANAAPQTGQHQNPAPGSS
jgi:hypothetical protein